MRAAALAAALVFGLAACGGSDEPKKELLPGTLTVGALVVSARDRVIANGARIGVGEINSLGGIAGKVRVRFVTAPDAPALLRHGARAILLPCEPGDQAGAEWTLRGRRVFAIATCNSLRRTRSWGVGPSVADRADALVAALRDRGIRRIEPWGSNDPAATTALRRAGVAWGLTFVGPPGDVILTGSGWSTVARLRRGSSVAGLDRLDSARGRAAAGARAEGTIYATFGYPVPGSELDELYEKYRLDYGARPDGSEVQLGYDALRVIDRAVQQAKTTDPKEIAANLPGLSIGGAGGVLEYPEDGSRQPSANVAVVEVRDGRPELVHRGRPERP